MSTNEITLISTLAGFGSVVGVVAGTIVARKGKELSLAIGASLLIATIVPLVFWYSWTVIDAVCRRGSSMIDAFLAGLGVLFLIGFSVPVVCGIPAMTSAAISHFFIRRCCARHAAAHTDASSSGDDL